jgi:hypothetical protein
MDDRQNLSQPESLITTTEKSPSRNLQKKTCTAPEEAWRRDDPNAVNMIDTEALL